ncbi:hypothetical protein QC763_0048700 [Podospora pseudopauciseta]|uniref:Uncharacterized protein n=2 Tax=Podospora TaxID=5144 RepID=A0ABR0HFC9_9PEZI|nr:hypothetical protein QC763_0048700 [Podospora pseudopauciseta]KAK4677772.1 hypothetical protein QC764_0048310 [Podospora pseudoanserina]
MFTTWHPLASALTPGQQQAHNINFQFDRRQPCGSLGQHNAPDARISPGKRFKKREKKNRLGGYETSSRGFPSPPALSLVHQTTETHPEGGVGPASEAPFTRSIVAARCCIPT